MRSTLLLLALAPWVSRAEPDNREIVARNDVVYTKPGPQPWEAMPVGGADLSAMVRWDGSLRLHLTKSDA